MSGSPDCWLLFLSLCSLKATDVAENWHVVDTDSSSVPQQAERFTAQHGPAQLVPPLGHTGGNEHNTTWSNRHDYNDVYKAIGLGCPFLESKSWIS